MVKRFYSCLRTVDRAFVRHFDRVARPKDRGRNDNPRYTRRYTHFVPPSTFSRYLMPVFFGESETAVALTSDGLRRSAVPVKLRTTPATVLRSGARPSIASVLPSYEMPVSHARFGRRLAISTS